MKKKTIAGAMLVALVAGIVAQQVRSGDDIAKEMRQPTAEEQMKMMQDWMKLMQPSQGHERLEPFIGEWNSVTKLWMGGPDAPASENNGTCTREWVLGKRFILEKVNSQMMMPDPASGAMKPYAFEGMGIFGYDNFRNVYNGSWADNMGTQLLVYKGACDPSGKVFTYYGEMDEPGLNVVGRLVKYVMRVVDQDKQVFEMYDLHVSEDYKVMEITYTRKK